LEEFPLRNFKGEKRRTQTCLVCVPKKSANRKRWRETSAVGIAWRQRCDDSETVAASKSKTRESDTRKETDLLYRTSDAGLAAAARKRAKLAGDADLRLMKRVGSKMSRMVHGDRRHSNTVLRWTGLASSKELREHLEGTCKFELDSTDYHIDHTIAKVWFMYSFNGMRLHKHQILDADMHRCWNPRNLSAMVAKENMSKSY
jgi:hypothetical protein